MYKRSYRIFVFTFLKGQSSIPSQKYFIMKHKQTSLQIMFTNLIYKTISYGYIGEIEIQIT
ncbi:hypothetical protein pb186bvf_011978 [Paramecium bursaria]